MSNVLRVMWPGGHKQDALHMRDLLWLVSCQDPQLSWLTQSSTAAGTQSPWRGVDHPGASSDLGALGQQRELWYRVEGRDNILFTYTYKIWCMSLRGSVFQVGSK